MNIKICYLLFFIFFSKTVLSQNDSIRSQKTTVNLSGFLDFYIGYDFNQPNGIEKKLFLYNHNRHNELNLNLGFIKLAIENAKYRVNLAFHAGTYSQDNYAVEPGLLKNVFEANAGFSLNKKNNLWLDAGVFSSHIGFESAISTDNWTMTRSILAENSPYFLSGAKLTFKPNSKWEIAALLLNGWQRIDFIKGNSMPSVGTQIKFSPTEKVIVNWSTFIGTNDPDVSRRLRYFNNFYGQFQFTEKLGLIIGFDIGAQQRVIGSSVYDIWFSPVFIGQYAINKSWKTAIRAEYYQDKTGIIIQTGTPNGFQTSGFSCNFDYLPKTNIIFRIEGRWLNSTDKIFENSNSFSNNDFVIASSIAIKFPALLKSKNKVL